MAIFKDVTLFYEDAEYTIKSKDMMKVICEIEEVITLSELIDGGNKVKIAKLACAYGTVLRFAGCRVTDEEIYQKNFSAEAKVDIMNCVTGLLMLMVPPPELLPTLNSKKKVSRKKSLQQELST